MQYLRGFAVVPQAFEHKELVVHSLLLPSAIQLILRPHYLCAMVQVARVEKGRVSSAYEHKHQASATTSAK